METGHPSTRAINLGSGNWALLTKQTYNTQGKHKKPRQTQETPKTKRNKTKLAVV